MWDVKVGLEFLDNHLFASQSCELRPKSNDEDSFADQFIDRTTTPTLTAAQETRPAEFARGMIAEFEITSKKWLPFPNGKEMFVQLFAGLTDARKQRARIVVYSQGYQAYSIAIGGFWDRLKGKWNRLAYKINSRFDKVVENPYAKRTTSPDNPGQATLNNAPMLIQGKILPTFLTLEDKLMAFVWCVRRRDE